MDLKLSRSKSKYLRSLRRSKQRRLSGKFVAEGDKLCQDILRDYADDIEWIICTSSWEATQRERLKLVKERLILVDEAEIKEHSQLEAPSPVILIANIPASPSAQQLPDSVRILYLDGLQDPGNVGTIIRTAAWFGLDAVILGPGTVDAFNAKVVQASMGAILRIPFLAMPLPELIEKRPDLPVFGLLMAGKSLWESELKGKGIVVLGNEGAGIQRDYLPLVQGIHIPGHPDSNMESLNAGTAAAIALAKWSS